MLPHRVKLVTSTGALFEGCSSQPVASSFRAVVAPCVSHSGHVEVATDPSYRGQLVALAHPVAGAAGGEPQSSRAWLSGMIAAAFAERSQLLSLMSDNGVPAIEVADHSTLVADRAAWIAVGPPNWDERSLPAFDSDSAAETAALAQTETGAGPLVVVADFGCKRGLVSELVQRGLRVRCVSPWALEDALSEARAVVLSSGPGSPSDFEWMAPLIGRAQSRVPVLGVCLGHQLLGLANGCLVARLARGHHGPNRAAIDRRGKLAITSHNHSFAISQLAAGITVTHTDAADGAIEGIRVESAAWAVGVQFHPEGRPGPRSPAVLDEFASVVVGAACR